MKRLLNGQALAGRVRRVPGWKGLARPPQAPPGFRAGPPDFVGVGVQKAGTSWWFSLICDHPGVYRAPGVRNPKERHFFDRFWNGGFAQEHVRRYHAWFPRPQGAVTGEWTPRYLVDYWTAPLLERAAPEAKLLVLLRDPVERYRSGLTHALRSGLEPGPDLAGMAMLRGLYHQQLMALLDVFPRERVLVLQFERCLERADAELARTYRFLGLDDRHVPEALTRRVNETRVEKVPLDAGTRRRLVGLYSPEMERLRRDFPDIRLSYWPNFGHVA